MTQNLRDIPWGGYATLYCPIVGCKEVPPAARRSKTIVLDRASLPAQPVVHINTNRTLAYKVPEEEKEAQPVQAQQLLGGYKSAYVEMIAAL